LAPISSKAGRKRRSASRATGRRAIRPIPSFRLSPDNQQSSFHRAVPVSRGQPQGPADDADGGEPQQSRHERSTSRGSPGSNTNSCRTDVTRGLAVQKCSRLARRSSNVCYEAIFEAAGTDRNWPVTEILERQLSTHKHGNGLTPVDPLHSLARFNSNGNIVLTAGIGISIAGRPMLFRFTPDFVFQFP